MQSVSHADRTAKLCCNVSALEVVLGGFTHAKHQTFIVTCWRIRGSGNSRWCSHRYRTSNLRRNVSAYEVVPGTAEGAWWWFLEQQEVQSVTHAEQQTCHHVLVLEVVVAGTAGYSFTHAEHQALVVTCWCIRDGSGNSRSIIHACRTANLWCNMMMLELVLGTSGAFAHTEQQTSVVTCRCTRWWFLEQQGHSPVQNIKPSLQRVGA